MSNLKDFLGGAQFKSQLFTSAGSLTGPPGVTVVYATCVSPGGGGGGGLTSTTGSGGSGGSAGMECYRRAISISEGDVLTCDPGTGGAAGLADASGSDGTDLTIINGASGGYDDFVLRGGKGGAVGATVDSPGGAFSITTSGPYVIGASGGDGIDDSDGNNGGASVSYSGGIGGSEASNRGGGGGGGSSSYGQGGNGGDGGLTTATAGQTPGANTGAGGGGGGTSGGTPGPGGNGANGLILLEWTE